MSDTCWKHVSREAQAKKLARADTNPLMNDDTLASFVAPWDKHSAAFRAMANPNKSATKFQRELIQFYEATLQNLVNNVPDASRADVQARIQASSLPSVLRHCSADAQRAAGMEPVVRPPPVEVNPAPSQRVRVAPLAVGPSRTLDELARGHADVFNTLQATAAAAAQAQLAQEQAAQLLATMAEAMQRLQQISVQLAACQARELERKEAAVAPASAPRAGSKKVALNARATFADKLAESGYFCDDANDGKTASNAMSRERSKHAATMRQILVAKVGTPFPDYHAKKLVNRPPAGEGGQQHDGGGARGDEQGIDVRQGAPYLSDLTASLTLCSLARAGLQLSSSRSNLAGRKARC